MNSTPPRVLSQLVAVALDALAPHQLIPHATHRRLRQPRLEEHEKTRLLAQISLNRNTMKEMATLAVFVWKTSLMDDAWSDCNADTFSIVIATKSTYETRLVTIAQTAEDQDGLWQHGTSWDRKTHE